MASHNKNYVLAVYMVLLLLQHHFGLISAYHLHKIRPPATVRALVKPNPPAPVRALIKLNPPAMVGFRFNRYKKIEKDAYRPTTPGNSPGMGHGSPPGRDNKP